MRRLLGQAARHTGRVAHALIQIGIALSVTALGLLALLSWRLSRGPLDVSWLAPRLEQAINAEATVHIALGGAALAWEGFTGGVDQPIDIRVHDLVATDAAGKRIAAIPRAEVSLVAHLLLLGRVVPRAIEVDGARLRVTRAADGAITLALGEPTDTSGQPAAAPGGVPASLLRELGRPAAGSQPGARSSTWSQLRRVRIRDATLDVTDRQVGATWGLHGLGADLQRMVEGGIVGRADATLRLGDQGTHVTVTAELDAETHRTRLTASLGQIVPAALAGQIAGGEVLAPFALPVALNATVGLAPDLTPDRISAHADLGAGTLRLGQQGAIVFNGALDAEGTPDRMALSLPRLEFAARADSAHTAVQAHADIARAPGGGMDVAGTLDLDQVAFADLPALWPEGVGGPGARPWITRNIPDGMARNGHLDVALHLPADLSGATVTHVAGGIDGEKLAVHWLRPVPPIEDASAHLSIAGPDALDIAVTGGHQGGLRVTGGHVRIVGLDAADQFADIEGDLAGPVPELLAVLRHPRVKLLDRSPLPLKDAAGQIAGKVTVTKLPLRNALTMDDVDIRTTAKLTGLRLPGVVAGRDLDHGTLSLDAASDGLHASGSATLAGLPADLQLVMDFRAGPPSQIQEKITVAGTVTGKQLGGLGLDVSDVLAGGMALEGTLAMRRDGTAEAAITADLAQATLTAEPVGFTKPAGRPATLTATVRLDGNTVTAIAPFRLEGESLHVDGDASFAAGRPDTLKLRRAALGPDTDLRAEVRIPRGPGDPWRVDLAGTSLDVTSQLDRKPTPDQAPSPAEPPPGPPYVVDVRLDRVVLGKGRYIADVVAHADNDGRLMRAASIAGRTVATGGGVGGGGAPFQLAIVPKGGVRQLTGGTADAGALLLALDIDDKMQGGKMTLTGHYDDTRRDHPLAGTATIEDFRIHKAPVLAKLLEAMTLYGLVELAQGPGLGFARLEAPFRLSRDMLELSDARAFNASLGMTAKGIIDLARQTADVQGTIVPAYFFNSLLGDIPLLGKLFSPERGGGLFAATYYVHGALDDPSVSVNPLAALTPGFLRGVFGLFDSTPNAPEAPSQPRPGQAR